MNLSDTMDALGTALENITGLRVFPWPNFAATPPCGIVGYPDSIEYDLTFQASDGISSGDHATFKVWLAVGSQVERTARDALSLFVSSDEAKSIKLAIEDNAGLTCRVTDCKIVTINMGGKDFLAAEYSIEVWG